jgi:hypothetical protein
VRQIPLRCLTPLFLLSGVEPLSNGLARGDRHPCILVAALLKAREIEMKGTD